MDSCMSVCGDQQEVGDAKRRHKEIEKQLKKSRNEDLKTHKILLLGTGESGKSTIKKQMQIIHKSGFSKMEQLHTVPEIRRNIKESILTMVTNMELLDIKLDNPDNMDSFRYIVETATLSNHQYTDEFYDHVSGLWADDGVRQCYRKSSEFQLLDSAKYFLDRIEVIRKSDYLPNDQDILRCRVVTTRIQQIDFTMKEKKETARFSAYDVGGQRGERRKWIQVFDRSTAILFLVDMGSFDMTLREEPSKNRLLESLSIFDQVWNNRYLRKVSIILFLNKIDVLSDKVSQGRELSDYLPLIDDEIEEDIGYEEDPSTIERLNKYKQLFSNFSSPQSLTDADRDLFLKNHPNKENVTEDAIRTAVFIKNMFMQVTRGKRKMVDGSDWHSYHSCEYFYTCAVDTDNIRHVLNGCKTIIIKEHLRRLSIST